MLFFRPTGRLTVSIVASRPARLLPRRPSCFLAGWQTNSVAKEHEEQDALLVSIQSAMGSLLGSTSGSTKNDAERATRLEALKADVSKFGKDALENLEHEELSFVSPVVRKVRKACGIYRRGPNR